MIIIGAVYIHRWSDYGYVPTNSSLGLSDSLLIMLFISAVVGVAFSLAWFAILNRYAGKVIAISMFTHAALWFGGAAAAFVFGVNVAGVIFLLFGLFVLLYFYCVRSRIPFSEQMIKSSNQGISHFYGLFFTTAASALLSAAYIVFWCYAVNAVISIMYIDTYKDDPNADEPSTNAGLTWFGFILSLYWTVETIANINVTTVAGAIGTWWYNTAAEFGTVSALRRASTYSLGSIALGSFIVAFLQTLQYMLRMATKDSNSLMAACLLCLVQLIEGLVRYFNKYAYVQIALYGKDFISAASDTFDLFAAKGFDMLINDDLTEIAVSFGALIGGVVNAIAVGLPFYELIKDDVAKYGDNTFIVFMLCFIIGYSTSMLLLAQITAAVATTFVIWAEDPDAMQRTRPEEYAAISEARTKFYQ